MREALERIAAFHGCSLSPGVEEPRLAKATALLGAPLPEPLAAILRVADGWIGPPTYHRMLPLGVGEKPSSDEAHAKAGILDLCLLYRGIQEEWPELYVGDEVLGRSIIPFYDHGDSDLLVVHCSRRGVWESYHDNPGLSKLVSDTLEQWLREYYYDEDDGLYYVPEPTP